LDSAIRRAIVLGTILAITVIVAACSGAAATSAPTTVASLPPASSPPASNSASPSTGGGGTTGNAVTIKDFAFDPNALTAKVGTEVTWTNQGAVNHTVTFDSGGVDSGNLLTGGTFKHTFDTAGTFTYHCRNHPVMTASITVTP